jgi:iron-sulfur cluster repair protein YtfE (RIC family)
MDEWQEDEIYYNPDEYEYRPEDEDRIQINYEDLFIEAHNSGDLEKYKEIISLEKDNSDQFEWAFKSYEQICLLYIKQKDIESFKQNLDDLFNLYTKVDDVHKQDTINGLCDGLRDINDDEFSHHALEHMLNLLTEKRIDREVINTGTQFAKLLLHLNKLDEFETVLVYLN